MQRPGAEALDSGQRASQVARLDPGFVRQRDRQMPVAIEQPGRVDDRDADDLAVLVVADTVALRRQRGVGSPVTSRARDRARRLPRRSWRGRRRVR